MTREDAELRALDFEEIVKLTTGGRDGRVNRCSSYESQKERSNSIGDRGAVGKQAGMTGPPSDESSVLGHVQARAWAGQVSLILVSSHMGYKGFCFVFGRMFDGKGCQKHVRTDQPRVSKPDHPCACDEVKARCVCLHHARVLSTV